MAQGTDRKLDKDGMSRGLKMENLQKFFQALTKGDEKEIDKIASQMAEMGMRPPPPELVDALLQSMEQQGQQQQQAQGAQVPQLPAPQQQQGAGGLGALLASPNGGVGQIPPGAGGGQPNPQEAELLQQLLSGAL